MQNLPTVPGYTVTLIHDGTDWGVLRATADDDPDTIYPTHKAACDAARMLAAEHGCSWFDLELEP